VRCWLSSLRARAGAAGIVLAAAALVASGCGNERRDFRVEQLNPRIVELGERRAELAALLRTARPRRKRDVAALREQLDRVEATMRSIATLDPPDGTEDRLRRYARANTTLLRALSRFIDAFASADATRQERAAAEVQAAVTATDRAKRRLQLALK
jgi:hypothetical protein